MFYGKESGTYLHDVTLVKERKEETDEYRTLTLVLYKLADTTLKGGKKGYFAHLT